MNQNTQDQATLTRPAPATDATDGAGTAPPRHREQHHQVNWLRDVILGGQDGDWRKNGLKMVAIGLGAAAAGFLIGRLFHTA